MFFSTEPFKIASVKLPILAVQKLSTGTYAAHIEELGITCYILPLMPRIAAKISHVYKNIYDSQLSL
jgi:hypothetical protein